MKALRDLLSFDGLTREAAVELSVAELKARVRECARLFAAWPNARPACLDLTLLEYVNATRGIPLDHLRGLIETVISAGGEFIPPAGAILERAARDLASARSFTYNGHISTDQLRLEYGASVERELRSLQRGVEPVCIEAVQRALAIEPGERPGLSDGRSA